MAIKGLTDRASVTPRFTRLGKICKGKRVGDKLVDLDHFRFVGKGARAAEIEAAFKNAYGEEPREIKVFLPHKTVEENWQSWQEEWGKSGLIHRCDGEIMVQWLNADLSQSLDYAKKQERACPYFSGEKERTKKKPGCTIVGRLAVIIPELWRAGYIGYVTVELHSRNDLPNLTASLLNAEAQTGAARNPTGLQGIEFLLRRQIETIGVRYQNKKGAWIKTRKPEWMVRIDPAQRWVLYQLDVSQQRALGEAVSRPALTMIDAEAINAPADLLPDVGGGFIEGEVVEDAEPILVREIKETPPEPPPPPTDPDPPTPSTATRPYPPEVLRDIIHKNRRAKRARNFTYDGKADRYRGAVRSSMELCFAGDPHSDQKRHLAAEYLVGEASSKKWDDSTIAVLHDFLKARPDDGGTWLPDKMAERELVAVAQVAAVEAGQTEMELD